MPIHGPSDRLYLLLYIAPCQIEAVISLLLSVLFEVVVGVFYRHYFVSKFLGAVFLCQNILKKLKIKLFIYLKSDLVYSL